MLDYFDYDYEIYRTNAVVIVDNEIFKGKLHFDCLQEIFSYSKELLNLTKEEVCKLSESELIELIECKYGKTITTELCNINNTDYCIIYDLDDLDTLEKLFPYHKKLVFEYGYVSDLECDLDLAF